jgi:DNA-binding HxlR family transcriptional regulator
MVAGAATQTAPARGSARAGRGDRTTPRPTSDNGHPGPDREACCGLYHRAVELVGKRWTGAILLVLLGGPLRFSQIRTLVPDLSDRLLSERLKELEAEDIVERRVIDGSPVRVEYALTYKGRALEPTVRALKSWAHDWLC